MLIYQRGTTGYQTDGPVTDGPVTGAYKWRGRGGEGV